MRKGKGDDVTEADMESVVHAHNCESPPEARTVETLLKQATPIVSVMSRTLSHYLRRASQPLSTDPGEFVS